MENLARAQNVIWHLSLVLDLIKDDTNMCKHILNRDIHQRNSIFHSHIRTYGIVAFKEAIIFNTW